MHNARKNSYLNENHNFGDEYLNKHWCHKIETL